MNLQRSTGMLAMLAGLAGCTGQPDLVIRPAPAPAGYCRDYDVTTLRVMVANQGREAAPASTTSVTFSRGGWRQDFATPPLPPGDSTVVGPADVHNCPGSICNLILRVDEGNVVPEENEANNESIATCTPPVRP